MKNIFSILYPFTTEAYPTPIRTIGYGTACAIGRLGSITMPYILFPLYSFAPSFPFIFFTFVSCLGVLASYALPFDTNL